MAGSLEQFLVILKAETGEFTSRINAASNDVSKIGSKGANVFQKLGSVGGAALAGIAAGAVAVGISSVKLADSYEAAHARLDTALKNTGSSFDAVKGKVAALTESGAKFGYNATEIETALATMTTGLGNAGKATGALGVVEDLAAAKHVDLNTAALAVTKAYEGQLRPLKQLGIDLPVAAGGALKTATAYGGLVNASKKLDAVNAAISGHLLNGKSAWTAHAAAVTGVQNAQRKFNDVSHAGDSIIAALGQRLKGQASAQAETFGGKVKALHASMQDLQIQLGTALIPIIEKLATVMVAIIGWFEKHRAAAIALGVVVGGILTTSFLAWFASLTAVDIALGVLLSPIGAIIAAVAALAVGVILLWTHWNQVWNWISHHKGIAIVIALIVPIIPLIFAVVAAAKFLQANWDRIWTDVSNVMKVVWNVVNAYVRFYELIPGRIIGAFFAVLSFFGRLPGLIGSAFASLASLLYSIGANAVSRMADGIAARAFGIIWFFANLGNTILNALGNLGNILYDIGRSIMDGLKNGIVDGFNAVKNFVSSIGSTIASLKGPPAHDKVLFVENGRLIMQGLQAGLEAGMGPVRDQLKGYTSELNVTGTVPALSSAAVGRGGPTVVAPIVNINNPAGNGREIADQVVAALKVGYGRSDFRRALGVA